MDTAVWQFFLALRVEGLSPWIALWSEVFRPRWLTVYAAALSLLLLVRTRGRAPVAALFPVVAVLAANLASELLKPLIGRERPPEGYHLVLETSLAMPSGHATGAMAFAVVLTMVFANYRWLMVLVWGNVLSVSLTRLYLGVRWLSDIFAGWALGAALPLLLFTLVPKRSRIRW